jgi:hypothetical protein
MACLLPDTTGVYTHVPDTTGVYTHVCCIVLLLLL